ncbi:hematopoietic cell signal transducer [Talpa occidentalis]|uniref:hematopoietic cell signal transducer n=1 Tax=Talpa occidentalis TaxID=50954 RepID=UPI0023F8F299|nr:hematopoietic cell signal transducer [Talpa occidentalis]
MVPPGKILLLLLLPVAAAEMVPGSCPGCGPPSPKLQAALVAADAVVSLLILAAVFVYVRLRARPTQEESKVYINMPGRG